MSAKIIRTDISISIERVLYMRHINTLWEELRGIQAIGKHFK